MSDTAGAFTAAGPIGGPTAASVPFAGSSPSSTAELGNLSGETAQVGGEIGSRYVEGGPSSADYHFSLSQPTTLSINFPATNSAGTAIQLSLFSDTNGNLVPDTNEFIQPTSPGVWTLPAGSNYYFIVNASFADNKVYTQGQFTMGVTSNATVPTPAASSKLAGTVFGDTNMNGLQDVGETGLPLAAIELTGTDNQGNAVAVFSYADAQGNYTFNNVPPSSAGGYTLTENPYYSGSVALANGKNSPGSLGGTAGVSSIGGIVVAAGTSGKGYNFADAPLAPVLYTTLSGTVFVDNDTQGVPNAANPGIAGVTVTLTGTDVRYSSVNLSATTDANGNYTFNNVPPSSTTGDALGTVGYLLTLTQPTNYKLEDGIGGNLPYAGTRADGAVLAGIKINGIAGTNFNFLELPLAGATAPAAANMTVTTMQNQTATGTVMTPAAQPAATTAIHARALTAVSKTKTSTTFAELVPGSGPSHAQSFVLNADGTFTYVPVQNFYGTDSFKYELIGPNGVAATAVVSLQVTHVFQQPGLNTESNYHFTISNNQAISIDLSTQVTDSDGLPVTFKIKSASGGTANISASGILKFTPSPYFTGNASVTYTASDGKASSVLIQPIGVMQHHYAPVALATSGYTTPSTAVTLKAIVKDSDPNATGVMITGVSQPKNGTAYIDNEGSTNPANYRIVYRPNFGFHGTDTFKYRIIDFYGNASYASVSVTVLPGAGLGIDPSNPNQTALDIFGTPGNDTISIFENGGGVGVTMNNVFLGTYNPTGLIAAFEGSGNNTIDASGISQRVALFGGTGNDKLIAGSGNALLVGGGGCDTLIAGNGTDDIIAGSVDYTTKGFGPLVKLFSGGNSLGSYAHADSGLSQIYIGKGSDTIWARPAPVISTRCTIGSCPIWL